VVDREDAGANGDLGDDRGLGDEADNDGDGKVPRSSAAVAVVVVGDGMLR